MLLMSTLKIFSMPLNYKIYTQSIEIQSTRGVAKEVSTDAITKAVTYTHEVFDKFIEFEVDVFSILGMRNLSAFVGEVFAQSLSKFSEGLLISNPHQDGYPDLLLMDDNGKADWERLRANLKAKAPFSPFPNGGIEIKSTCGSVPTPEICRKKGVEKPSMGDQRISVLTGYDWKAHHRETNNLIGIFWDFLDRVPRIVALFYSETLSQDDWGKIVQPKDGGGRTTSVSIMSRQGIKKMYNGTIIALDDERYLAFFNAYNASDKL